MSNIKSNLNFAVVPQEFLEKIENEVLEVKEILLQKTDEEIANQWIESRNIPKIQGISRKTWQTYRDKRLIPFSQIGNKIYVKRADLEQFMEDHKIEAISNEPLNC